ncbi:MAG TPA: enolase C-terminal domain-like protein, partial [Candidatus Binatia bacterium]|nr:enolase C-terminal domain-like protein [Candidatus Binatia bacterium]
APATALAATAAALAGAAGWLRDASLDRLDALRARLASLDRPAAAGLDTALHDLLGHATGRSVAELLGGPVRRRVPASALLDAEDPHACGAAAAAARARGFACAKLKLAPDLDRALARAAAAHAAAPGLRLRLDANGALDVDAAVRAARALAPLGVEWLEQPVAADDLRGMARVRREGGVRIAADEAVTGADAVARLAAAAAADAVVLKLVQVGGLAAAVATARAAAARGLAVTVTTSLDTRIATAAALHLAAALPDPLRPCGLATRALLAGDLVREPAPDGPSLALPPGPGLGVTLDRARLARWREERAA